MYTDSWQGFLVYWLIGTVRPLPLVGPRSFDRTQSPTARGRIRIRIQLWKLNTVAAELMPRFGQPIGDLGFTIVSSVCQFSSLR